MNCSQLLERRTVTNWERPAQPERNFTERPEQQSTETYRWSTVRFSSVGQTLQPGSCPPSRDRTSRLARRPEPARRSDSSARHVKRLLFVVG